MKAYPRCVHVQTILTEEELDTFIKKVNGITHRDAIRKAIIHYTNCPIAEKEESEELDSDKFIRKSTKYHPYDRRKK